ncbi:DUF429 domain-containing protein [Paenibacillus piri]|uniref:DUF429 domain-containing protein n=1 Tax=Paenibacillus piri TaxID=2547395 RepID=A0A4R5KRV9_9BACL|nr:DUF429 domain-containing protein [Paenibacillus piri]
MRDEPVMPLLPQAAAVADVRQPFICTGIDGCRAGWIAVTLTDAADSAQLSVHPSIESLWESRRQSKLLLIDMPIGLISAGTEERLCDRLARQRLRPHRMSSIFPVPVRAVLTAATYEEAGAINRRLAGRGLSKQSWHLVPKICELDILLRARKTPAAVSGKRIRKYALPRWPAHRCGTIKRRTRAISSGWSCSAPYIPGRTMRSETAC